MHSFRLQTRSWLSLPFMLKITILFWLTNTYIPRFAHSLDTLCPCCTLICAYCNHSKVFFSFGDWSPSLNSAHEFECECFLSSTQPMPFLVSAYGRIQLALKVHAVNMLEEKHLRLVILKWWSTHNPQVLSIYGHHYLHQGTLPLYAKLSALAVHWSVLIATVVRDFFLLVIRVRHLLPPMSLSVSASCLLHNWCHS